MSIIPLKEIVLLVIVMKRSCLQSCNNDLKLPSCKKLRKYLINYIINDCLEINRNTLNLYINKGTGKYFLIITIKDCFSNISNNVIN